VADKFEFLSAEWMDAARQIRDRYPATSDQVVRMNMVVTASPVGDGSDIKAHLDLSAGEMRMDVGHLDNPDVVVTIPYDTAKDFVVNGDQAVVMQAFMAGTIKFQGDMTKLLTLTQGQPHPDAAEVAQRIKDITA
jgi:putative sterol carrier protein